MGFRSVSFRLFKDFNIDNGQELTPEESAKLPLYQIFQLYIDPIVDNIHPEIKNLLGFVPIDEPLLSLVFQKGMHTIVNFFGKTTMLPKPHVLLAMKLNSAPRRATSTPYYGTPTSPCQSLKIKFTRYAQKKEQAKQYEVSQNKTSPTYRHYWG
jgi:hypothetical protein